MSSSIPRSRSIRSATGIPSIPTRTSSSRDASVPRTASPTRLPSLKHGGGRAVSTASSSSSSTTSLKGTAANGGSTGSGARAPPPAGGGPVPGRLARAMTMATTKEVTARKEKSALTNKYPPSTTVTRPSIQTRGRSASISMEGKPKELERRSTGLTYSRSSTTNLAGPTTVVKPASTSRSRDPIRRPATPTAQPGIPTVTRRAVTPTALPRSNTYTGPGVPVTPPSTKATTPPSTRTRSPSVGPSRGLSRAATFAFSGRSTKSSTTRSVTPTTHLSTNSAASSRAVTPTGAQRLLGSRAPSTEKIASRQPSTEKVTVRKPSTEKVATSRKPSLATLSRVVSRLSRPSSAGTLLSQDQASQLKRPSNPSLQRPGSPGKSLSAKPSASHLAPNSPSKLPANIAASAEVSKLQAELLQLYLLHQEAPIVDAEWRASAKQKLGDRFDRLSEESREVAEQESAGLEKRNVVALRRWGSGGRLDEKIQSLESIITNVWSLSDPGGRYARVVRHFEIWVDGVSEMEVARSKGVVLVHGDDSLFIEDLDAHWKEEREDLIHLLEDWRQQLGDIDDLSRDDLYAEPPDEDEKSSLEKMLDGSRSLIDDMLAELRIMEVIEQEALVREDEWIDKMNGGGDDDVRLSRGAWNEM